MDIGGFRVAFTTEKCRSFIESFVISYLEISMASMHSGTNQDCLTDLYFEDWMSFFKIKFIGTVLVVLVKCFLSCPVLHYFYFQIFKTS